MAALSIYYVETILWSRKVSFIIYFKSTTHYHDAVWRIIHFSEMDFPPPFREGMKSVCFTLTRQFSDCFIISSFSEHVYLSRKSNRLATIFYFPVCCFVPLNFLANRVEIVAIFKWQLIGEIGEFWWRNRHYGILSVSCRSDCRM